jgi:hypothetical protein
MRRMYRSAVAKVLVFAVGALLALMISGCNDPVASEIKAQRRRMGDECRIELDQDLAGFPPTTRALMFRPAR